MKPFTRAPQLEALYGAPVEVFRKVARVAHLLDDSGYLHWQSLKYKQPPSDLTPDQWWLALKLKRSFGQIEFPTLTAKDGTHLRVTRHARLDAGFARMDRLIGGQVAMPEAARNEATRDQFIASSLMEEAIHSSLFEGAVSTREAAKELLRSDRRPINRDERMIVNNYRAMLRIREMAKSDLTVDCLLELHKILTDGTLKDPSQAGRFQRDGEQRVQVIDDRLHRVVHVPPPAGELQERIERLVAFANEEDIVGEYYVHPVLRSILLHFQLAYDHPFWDGNGRTARALFYWSMLRRGYWLAEYISISRLLYKNRSGYEEAYLQVESDAQDGTYFVLQQLTVLEAAVDELFEYVNRKSQAQRQLRLVLNKRDDLNHRQLALLGHALKNPTGIYTHESHGNSHRVSVMTARADLLALVDRGWLTKSRSGKRFIYRPAPELERLLAPAKGQ